MPGSGTFSVESVIGSVVPVDGKLLVLNNGAYGARITTIARMLGIETVELDQAETESTDLDQAEDILAGNPAITHVAMVHCETTTGMLNPAEGVGAMVRRHGREFILDAMSSFGGIPMSMESTGAHYLISSANKCIQGVPGFGFVVADRASLESTKGRARSHSLDLHHQWHEMETKGGKWRFTSPTHVVKAFAQALDELESEGGEGAPRTLCCQSENDGGGNARAWFSHAHWRRNPVAHHHVVPLPGSRGLSSRNFTMHSRRVGSSSTPAKCPTRNAFASAASATSTPRT